MAYIQKFNPITGQFNLVNKTSSSGGTFTIKGVINDADTNPAFPSSPTDNDVWLIGTTSGTVGGLAVTPGDAIVYIEGSWELWDLNLNDAVYTDEEAQDAVGGILANTATINFTYADGTPSITANVNDDSVTNAKLDNMAANTVKVNATNGSANPTNLSLTASTFLGRGATGDIEAKAYNTFIERFSGTTANRSTIISSPVIGQLYSNTTTGRLEWYDGSTWRSLPFAQILLTEIQNIANNTFLGNLTGGSTYPREVPGLDIWDSSQQSYKYNIGGINEYLDSTIYSTSGDALISNTTTESQLISGGVSVGTLTLPANFFVPGKTIKGEMWGTIGTDATAPTLRLRVKFGGTTKLDSTAVQLLAVTGTQLFKFEFIITCSTTGASGQFYSQGVFSYYRDQTTEEKINITSNTFFTLNTTTTQALTITGQWGTADSDNAIFNTNFILKKLA